MKINKNELFFENAPNIQPVKTVKNKIILIDTKGTLEEHLTKLRLRQSGKYNKIPAFTVSQKGVIYQHYDVDYYSNIMHEDISKFAIFIALENKGWLEKTNEGFVDCFNRIYNGVVFDTIWRKKNYWDKYSDKQISELIVLLDYLCKKYNINKLFSGSNVIINGAKEFKGILCRSNFSRDFYDPTPAMNFEILTEKFDNYE